MDRSRSAIEERRLRVLIVAPSTNILGGQAVQASRLLAQLSAEPTVEVGFLPINPEFPRRLRRLQKIKYARTIINSALYSKALLARVRMFDVIHVFSASYFSFLLAPTPAIFTSKFYGKSVVLNYRSGEAEDHLRRWRRTAGFVLRLVDAIAVPSSYLVDVFGKFGLNARAIFNIVDTEVFRFRERRPLRPIFLCNRSLAPLYNVACVLRAFALIQQRFPEARLILAGDGEQRLELERLAKELGLRNTEFLGRIEPAEINEVYDNADIFLNGSDLDNMPGSILEAFASGLPVITTNAGGIPLIVTDGTTGFLVRCGDYQAMAARAITLLEDQDLAMNLAANARDECRKYAWDAVRDEWLKLYRELGGKFCGEHQVVGNTNTSYRRRTEV